MTDENAVAFALARLRKKDASRASPHFVVLILGTEPFDITDPEIIGPFPCYRDAYEWVARLPIAVITPADAAADLAPGSITLASPKGGICGWAIVGATSASDPQAYLREWPTLFQED
jgi:hypothetical protein